MAERAGERALLGGAALPVAGAGVDAWVDNITYSSFAL